MLHSPGMEKQPPKITRRDVLRSVVVGSALGFMIPMQGDSYGNIVQAGELQTALRPYTEPPREDTTNQIHQKSNEPGNCFTEYLKTRQTKKG